MKSLSTTVNAINVEVKLGAERQHHLKAQIRSQEEQNTKRFDSLEAKISAQSAIKHGAFGTFMVKNKTSLGMGGVAIIAGLAEIGRVLYKLPPPH